MLLSVTWISLTLILTITWDRSTAQLTYTIKATWLDDPETEETVALNENRWSSYTKEAENLGLTFAGKAEFPWIVDIRVEQKPMETWATGNLIKQDTIFTTCSVVDGLGDWQNNGDIPRVTFAQMYLWEYNLRQNPSGQDWHLGGSRNIQRSTKHEKCNVQLLYYDGGLLILTSPIKPSPPTINTITVTFDYRTGLLPDFDMSKQMEQRRVCYIASIGRDFINIKNTLVKDFKVRYRVYYYDAQMCNQWKDKMCPNKRIPSSLCTIDGINNEGKELMCFKTRAKVGVVCDHDKGAPLVCDGQTFGLVVLGALQQYCNDVFPLPFWVQKVTMFTDYFQATTTRGGQQAGRRMFESFNVTSTAYPLFKHHSVHNFLAVLIPFINF